MKKEVIIACDFATKDELFHFLQPFGTKSLFLKIGMELFYREGIPLIETLKQQGHKIFLDLKLHDIPTTVAKALLNLTRLEVELITVHAAGGRQMLHAAVQAVKGTPSKLLAVTILTSIDEEVLKQELLISETLANTVNTYAMMAYDAGIDGCICSPYEVKIIKENIAQNIFYCVTPGIRLTDDAVDDQSRVATPEFAFAQGADAIVIGRSITKADDPFEVYQTIIKNIESRGK